MENRLQYFKKKVEEYIKFNIIGTINFIVSQCLYITLFTVFKINFITSYTITSILSITASYFINSKLTFETDSYSMKKFLLTTLVYVFEYFLNLTIIILLVITFNVNELIAPIVAPVFSTLPMFLLMRAIIKNTDKVL